MIIISDETGCHGASYVNGSSSNYIVTIACFFDIAHLNSFVNLARENSRKHLGNRLRKWADLPSAVKNDPVKLEAFLNGIFSVMRSKNEVFTLSIFLMNKSEVELNHGRDKDKLSIINGAKKGYEYCFKRIFPFIKRWNYVSNNWLTPTQWYIDTNNLQFQDELHGIIKALRPSNVNLDGPHYIQKNGDKVEIVKAIKIIDLIGGITMRAFDYYTKNCRSCNITNCISDTSCSNSYINAWQAILRYASNIDLVYQEKQFWKWSGVIYHPIDNRASHNRFIGNDSFLHKFRTLGEF